MRIYKKKSVALLLDIREMYFQKHSFLNIY